LLLVGPPGVGKTHTAYYLADLLKLPLFLLDLSATISSYLGKTGLNIRAALDYARSQPALLFLDEFDAIAKRRDDPTDLGELKRIVNVLLKELETWPSNGIVVAATNHPDLLDNAIWRRFDQVIRLGAPGRQARQELIERYLGGALLKDGQELTHVFVDLTDGLSGADVSRWAERVLRQTVLTDSDAIRIAFQELPAVWPMRSQAGLRRAFSKSVKAFLGDSVSSREVGSWLGVSHSTVLHHLKGDETSG